MALSAEFDSRTDRRAYALVAAGAAALSYYHARAFFLPFMGPVSASVTPLMMDAVVYWLAAANVRQARVGRPLPMLRFGAYGLLALTITANALGGASLAERVFLALPAALFGFLVEARTRLALYHHRAAHRDDRLRVRLWLRHPVRAFAAWLWLARQSAHAFDRASAERDQLRAARDAVRLALPGRSRAIRRARARVLRELNAGRLPAVTAVTASGLLTRPGVTELHRAALAASLGADLARIGPEPRTDEETPGRTDRTGPDPGTGGSASGAADPGTGGGVGRAAFVAELADQIRAAMDAGGRWAPDYDALMARSGFGRSWCEKAVRDARTEAFRTAVRAPARTAVPDEPARTGSAPGPDEPARTGRPALHAVEGTGT